MSNQLHIENNAHINSIATIKNKGLEQDKSNRKEQSVHSLKKHNKPQALEIKITNSNDEPMLSE